MFSMSQLTAACSSDTISRHVTFFIMFCKHQALLHYVVDLKCVCAVSYTHLDVYKRQIYIKLAYVLPVYFFVMPNLVKVILLQPIFVTCTLKFSVYYFTHI